MLFTKRPEKERRDDARPRVHGAVRAVSTVFANLALAYGKEVGFQRPTGESSIDYVVYLYAMGSPSLEGSLDVRVAIECDGYPWHCVSPADAVEDRLKDIERQFNGYYICRFLGEQIRFNPEWCAVTACEMARCKQNERLLAGAKALRMGEAYYRLGLDDGVSTRRMMDDENRRASR